MSDELNGRKHLGIDFVDIGCGYGGLLFALSPHFPDQYMMGFEIRDVIVEYVGKKIRAKRMAEGGFENISILRTNTMKHLTNYIRKSSLEKVFICFPDPNFKTTKKNRRIVNFGFLSEYAYCLKPKGRIYCITDVQELHEWHVYHLDRHS